ncbi:MAG: heme-binding protein, partial [Alphaproteobacteria bacterium]
GPKWQDKFFLVEFTGSPARANLYAFDLKPDGAGFAFGEEEKVLNGILATGIEFGPEGALYVADWIDGWGTKDYGRIWKLDVPGGAQTAIRQETKVLLQSDFSAKADAELGTLLRHPDQRVRLEAQFALATRGNDGAKVFGEAMTQREHQLARVHGIWGTAQQARQKPARAEALRPLLGDADPEIRAQAARWLGDVRYAPAADDLMPLLADDNARVRFFAAEALGRIGHGPAVEPLIAMLRANDDKDVYLRHAGSLALARIGQPEPLVALARDDSKALRVAAVVALRRMQHPGVAGFLNDADGYVVAEAARAIHDDETIPEAMPALAALVGTTPHGGDPLLRRALNANFRLGGETEMMRVAAYAEDETAPVELRAEAVKMLGSWPEPSPLDRVDGRYRELPPRDAALARQVAGPVVERLLATRNSELQIAASVAAGRLKLAAVATNLDQLARRSPDASVRVAALQALAEMEAAATAEAVARGLKDRSGEVRSAALRLLPELDMAPVEVAALLEPVIATGETQEQQSALAALGDLPGEASGPVLARLMTRLESGRLSREIELDLTEIASAHPDTDLQSRVTAYQEARAAEDDLGPYRAALYGGNVRDGWMIFNRHEAAQCTRCHAIGGDGGGVGPDLAGIASRMEREEILRSLVNPSARIAPGYGGVSLTLTNGQTVSGILKEETPTELVLQVSEAEPMNIPLAQIERRINAPSSMPPMGAILSTRELRDLMAYLMRQTGE